MDTIDRPTRHVGSLALARLELVALIVAVLACMTSLVLAAMAGVVWFAVPLAIAAVPVLIAAGRGPSEPGRHRR